MKRHRFICCLIKADAFDVCCHVLTKDFCFSSQVEALEKRSSPLKYVETSGTIHFSSLKRLLLHYVLGVLIIWMDLF
jgi:hypothetical protein